MWKKTVLYWTAVFGLMVTDGDLGWDDVVIGLVAIPVFFRYLWKSK